jgi:hypothetical protein
MTVHVRRKGAVPVTTVESDQEPGKQYEIARLPDGHLACACMAYVFNKAKPKTCKHIEAYGISITSTSHRAKIAPPVEEIIVSAKLGETFTFKTKRAISFSPI